MSAVILVVEDEEIVAHDIRRTLVSLGYDVPRTVGTGRDAIVAAAESRPELVLMDIKLKGSIDGIEAATVIRSEHAVPILFLTSHSDEATLARAVGAGPSGYLLKPFDDRELRVSIEVALAKHRTETALAQKHEEERRASLGELALGVAHEINNPLAAIVANVGFALDGVREIEALPLVRSADGDTVPRRLAELEAALLDVSESSDRVRDVVRGLRSAGVQAPQSLTPPPIGDGASRFARPAARRGRVLVVDDEVKVATSLDRLLRGSHDVAMVTSGAEALADIAAGQRYDVIFCDLVMPVMTGAEMYEQLVALDPVQSTRIIFMTGGVYDAQAEAFLQQTRNVHISKPFSVETIRAITNDRVKEVLDEEERACAEDDS